MRAVSACIFIAVVAVSFAQDPALDNDTLNTIETKPSVRLDPYIRKALLKALSELEENDNTTIENISTEKSPVTSELLQTSDDTQNDTTKGRIQIHSFIVNGQTAFSNTKNTTPMLIDKKISILSTTAGNVESHVTATLPTQSPLNVFLQKSNTVNAQQVRSIADSAKKSNFAVTGTAQKSSTPTTTTTTTTTTPKPTHNHDGENIEEVDKRDVQVFQAPLVAAFTVHQDAQGIPKRVVPIFQQNNAPLPLKSSSTSNAPKNNLPNLPIPQNLASLPVQQNIPNFAPVNNNNNNINFNKISSNNLINQQIALQKQLEEKQRLLEEQLRLLQIQQRQQEELLRQQHQLLQQKEAQRQQQYYEQEKFKRQQQVSEQQRLQTLNNFHVQSLQNNPNQPINSNIQPPKAQVSIQQSIPLEHNNGLSNQQLPNREAVDFLLHLRSQQSEQFPLQENHLPQGISNFLLPGIIPALHPSFNQVRNIDDQFRQKQANRVFRQESGVGNFGVNQHFNRFGTFGQGHNNRPFIPLRANQYTPDADLKQLLAQTGLTGKSNEDLNIVSKVLSLNHGVLLNNNISNRLPFDSRRHVRTSL